MDSLSPNSFCKFSKVGSDSPSNSDINGPSESSSNSQNHDSQKARDPIKTEYKSKFTPFDQYIYDEISDTFVKNTSSSLKSQDIASGTAQVSSVSPDHLLRPVTRASGHEADIYEPPEHSLVSEPWYKEVVKRNEKASEYRYKSEVGHNSPLLGFQTSRAASPHRSHNSHYPAVSPSCYSESTSNNDNFSSSEAQGSQMSAHRYRRDNLIAYMANNNNFTLPKDQTQPVVARNSKAPTTPTAKGTGRLMTRTTAQTRSRSQSTRRVVPQNNHSTVNPSKTNNTTPTHSTTSRLATKKPASVSTVTRSTQSASQSATKRSVVVPESRRMPISNATKVTPARAAPSSRPVSAPKVPALPARLATPNRAKAQPAVAGRPSPAVRPKSITKNEPKVASSRMQSSTNRASPSTRTGVTSSPSTPTRPSGSTEVKSIKTPKALAAEQLAAAAAAASAAVVVASAAIASTSDKTEGDFNQSGTNVDESTVITSTESATQKIEPGSTTESQPGVDDGILAAKALEQASTNELVPILDDDSALNLEHELKPDLKEITEPLLSENIADTNEQTTQVPDLINGLTGEIVSAEDRFDSSEKESYSLEQGSENHDHNDNDEPYSLMPGQVRSPEESSDAGSDRKQDATIQDYESPEIAKPNYQEDTKETVELVSSKIDNDLTDKLAELDTIPTRKLSYDDDQSEDSPADFGNQAEIRATDLTKDMEFKKESKDDPSIQTPEGSLIKSSSGSIENMDEKGIALSDELISEENQYSAKSDYKRPEEVKDRLDSNVDLIEQDSKHESYDLDADTIVDHHSNDAHDLTSALLPMNDDSPLLDLSNRPEETKPDNQAINESLDSHEITNDVDLSEIVSIPNLMGSVVSVEHDISASELKEETLDNAKQIVTQGAIIESSPALTTSFNDSSRANDDTRQETIDTFKVDETHDIGDQIADSIDQEINKPDDSPVICPVGAVAEEEKLLEVAEKADDIDISSAKNTTDQVGSFDEAPGSEQDIPLDNHQDVLLSKQSELLMNVADLMDVEAKQKEEMARKSEIARQNSSPQSKLAQDSELLLSPDQLSGQLVQLSSKTSHSSELPIESKELGSADLEEKLLISNLTEDSPSEEPNVETSSDKCNSPHDVESSALKGLTDQTHGTNETVPPADDIKDSKLMGSCEDIHSPMHIGTQERDNDSWSRDDREIRFIQDTSDASRANLSDDIDSDEQLKLSNPLTNSEDELILQPRNYEYSSNLESPSRYNRGAGLQAELIAHEDILTNDSDVQLDDGSSAALESPAKSDVTISKSPGLPLGLPVVHPEKLASTLSGDDDDVTNLEAHRDPVDSAATMDTSVAPHGVTSVD